VHIHSILLYLKYRWCVVIEGHVYTELRGTPFIYYLYPNLDYHHHHHHHHHCFSFLFVILVSLSSAFHDLGDGVLAMKLYNACRFGCVQFRIRHAGYWQWTEELSSKLTGKDHVSADCLQLALESSLHEMLSVTTELN